MAATGCPLSRTASTIRCACAAWRPLSTTIQPSGARNSTVLPSGWRPATNVPRSTDTSRATASPGSGGGDIDADPAQPHSEAHAVMRNVAARGTIVMACLRRNRRSRLTQVRAKAGSHARRCCQIRQTRARGFARLLPCAAVG
jgi:hypothetical protein